MIDEAFVADNGGEVEIARAKAKEIFDASLGEFRERLNILTFVEVQFHRRFFPNQVAADSWYNGDENVWKSNIMENFWNTSDRQCVERDGIVFFTGRSGMAWRGVTVGSAICTSTSLPQVSGTVMFVRYDQSDEIMKRTLAHEVGHLLGLWHVQDTPCAADCNTSLRPLMCDGGAGSIMQLTSCDVTCLGYIFCNVRCNCLAYASPDYPDDFVCPPPTGPVQILVTADNPNPVVNCKQNGDVVEFTATLFNNNTTADRNIRVSISADDGTHAVFVPDATLNFDCIRDFTNRTEFWITNGNDDPNTPECEGEIFFELDPAEIVTVKFKVRFTGADPVFGSDFTVKVFTGTDPNAPGAVVKTFLVQPFVSITGNQFTVLSSTSWSFSRPLIISGNLTMNNSSPYDFKTNKKLLFHSGGGMEIAANSIVKMTAVSVAGCEHMWKGITVNQGASFETSMMSEVRDAQAAIKVRKGAKVIATNSRFINNNFSIQTDPGGSGAYDLTLLSNEYGNTNAGLKSAYSGQTPAPLGNGFAGIYLKDAGTVNISSYPGSQEPNLFFNLKYGIISDNTELNVRSALFDDIVQVAKGSGYDGFVFGPTGRAIYAQKGTARIIESSGQQLSFANCHTGVETLNATAYVWYTTMTGMTNGIITTNGDYSIHWFNTIEASDRGIELRHSSPLFKIPAGGALPTAIGGIYANEITLSGNPKGIGINTTGNTLIGININGAPTGPPQFTGGSIASNQITLLDGAKAIGLNATRNISAYDNTISLENAQGNAAGIVMSAGDQNSLSCNDIDGSGEHTGIYAIHSSLAKIKCNLTANMATGLSFKGMLMGKANTEVSGNNMKNNTTGLLYGVDAFTGTQEHRGNRWEGGSTLAIHQGIPDVAILSKYIVDNTEDPTYLPDDWDPILWFETNSNSHVETYDCPALAGNCIKANEVSEGTQEQATEVKIARGELPGNDYQAPNNWLAQRRLFERIAEEGNPYPGDTSITAFLTAAQTNGLAGFAALQVGIRQAFAVDTADQDSMLLYVDIIMTDLDSLAAIEQQLSAPDLDEQDSLDLTDLRDALQGEIAAAAQSKAELLGRLDSVRAVRADTLLVQNMNLPNLEVPYADNEKAINNILLRSMAKGVYTFSVQDSTKLAAIAAACPLSDGEAVLWARALLSFMLEAPAEYNDDSICVVERSHPKKSTNASHFRIYPNPAVDKVVVEYGLTAELDQPLMLFNTLGQLVQTFNLPKGEAIVQISLNPIPPGVYWYQSPGVATGKIIIHL